MHTHRFSSRAVALAALALAGGSVFAAAPNDAEIYQQRAADGSIVLTDRPSPKAVTERTWQMQHEDAGAVQRALEVRREADAVSERIQRQIEAQQRLAANDIDMRMRVARLDRGDDGDGGYDDGIAYGGPLIGGYVRRHRTSAWAHQPGPQRGGHPQAVGSRSAGGAGFGQR